MPYLPKMGFQKSLAAMAGSGNWKGKAMLKRWMKAMISSRVVNAVFAVLCVAAACGAPVVWVMGVSAVLYAVLVWVGG
jgi:hypothetical protein